MKLSRVDLNLLVYLDALLREKNVTRAAEVLGITQPALSNGLRRLRNLLEDPILVRTSDGMRPTQRGIELQPQVREILAAIEAAIGPGGAFDAASSRRVFRIMASDYAESTLLAPALLRLQHLAPEISLDILTPSDVSYEDLEQGKVDMAINRFDRLPQSFHQTTLWHDGFSCLMSRSNKAHQHFDMDTYLAASHIWVSKTGMGIGRGMSQRDGMRLGWVDEALAEFGHQRRIRVFTRHYQVAALLAGHPELVATLPEKMAALYAADPRLVIRKPPFMIIPIELQMAWSPLLQHDAGHIWLRRQLLDTGREIAGTKKGAL